MGFLAIAVAYTMRVCLAVAIVEMVVEKNQTASNDSIICPVDPAPEESNSTKKVLSMKHIFFGFSSKSKYIQ